MVEALRPTVTREFQRVRWDEGMVYAVRCVCLNLLTARVAHPDTYVFFSRTPRDYTHRPVTYRRLMRIVQTLEGDGLIESDVGEWGGNRSGVRSRMRSLPLLMGLFQEHRVRPSMVETTRPARLVQVRDSDGNEISLSDDAEIRAEIDLMSANLVQINQALHRAFVGLHISDDERHRLAERMSAREPPWHIDFSRKYLHRIFNNSSLNEGGRFYGGWWQNIPREYRKHIHIGHEGGIPQYAAEIDYSAIHPAIAYASAGLRLDFDPYEVEPTSGTLNEGTRGNVRKVAKMALNAMINAPSRTSAARAITSKLVLKRDREQVRTGEPFLPEGCPPVNELIGLLLMKNEPIADIMCTGYGTRLMNVEARIAEITMLKMIDEAGAVVLPLHDSFLVHRSYRHILDRNMRDSFFEETGQRCSVDLDPMEIDDQEPMVISGRESNLACILHE